MTSPFGQPGTRGSVRLAGSIAGSGPPPAGAWEELDIVIDADLTLWLWDGSAWTAMALPLSGGTIHGDVTIGP